MYVVVTGDGGSPYGIALYIDDGGNCLADKLKNPFFIGSDKIDHFYAQLKQDFIMMSLSCKSGINTDYVAEVQAYAKENGISLRGKNSFPDFMRFIPQRAAWSVDNKKTKIFDTGIGRGN